MSVQTVRTRSATTRRGLVLCSTRGPSVFVPALTVSPRPTPSRVQRTRLRKEIKRVLTPNSSSVLPLGFFRSPVVSVPTPVGAPLPDYYTCLQTVPRITVGSRTHRQNPPYKPSLCSPVTCDTYTHHPVYSPVSLYSESPCR